MFKWLNNVIKKIFKKDNEEEVYQNKLSDRPYLRKKMTKFCPLCIYGVGRRNKHKLLNSDRWSNCQYFGECLYLPQIGGPTGFQKISDNDMILSFHGDKKYGY